MAGINVSDITAFDKFDNSIITYKGDTARVITASCELHYKLIDDKWLLHRDQDQPACIGIALIHNTKTLLWYINGKLHRGDDKPAYVVYNIKTHVAVCSRWYQHGVLTRIGKPARIIKDLSGDTTLSEYYLDNVLHNEAGPASIAFYCKGILMHIMYYVHGELTKLVDDEPACTVWNRNGTVKFTRQCKPTR